MPEHARPTMFSASAEAHSNSTKQVPAGSQAPGRVSSALRARRVAAGAEVEVLTPLRKIAERTNLPAIASNLSDLQAWLSDDLTALDTDLTMLHQALVKDKPGTSPLARNAAAHLLSAGGKRIRPLCVLLGARIGGRDFDIEVRNLAVAAELVHAATLLHDDVLDEGTERRGAPTARMVYGNSASVLAGDHLLVHALKLVSSTTIPNALHSILEVIDEMVASEALQLDQRGSLKADRDVYDRVIRGKTAALFHWSLVTGANAGELSSEACEALSEVGTSLGMAFQLADDLLDIDGVSGETGKNVFADLREGKLTWPLILAVERDSELLPMLSELASQPDDSQDVSMFAPILSRVRATGAIEATRERAQSMGETAKEALLAVPAGTARDALQAIIDASVERSL